MPWSTDRCIQCGKLLTADDGDKCGNCTDMLSPIALLHCVFNYENPIKYLIAQMKFGKKTYPARILEKFMLEYIEKKYPNTYLPEVIIPVPLHIERIRERGFNQSELIANLISKKLNIAVDKHSCQRIKNTAPQARKSKVARYNNIRSAFKVIKPIQYKYVAIFDDVVTTGATIREMAKTLIKAGVEEIHVWSICHG